jgi:hypothetical protein
MSLSPYDRDLDRKPLTPLSFLERAAQVFPDRLAIAHGALRLSLALKRLVMRVGDKARLFLRQQMQLDLIAARTDIPWRG